MVSQLQRLSVKVIAYQYQPLPEPGPVPLRPWVLSLLLPSLCFVLEGQTVSGVARLSRVGSFEMQGKRDLCQLRPIVFAIPGLGGIRAGHRIYVAGSLG